MKAHKREIVGVFLSSEVSGRAVSDKKDKICGEWMKACPLTSPTDLAPAPAAVECSACNALVNDTAFLLRRAALWPGHTHWAEKQVYEALEQACLHVTYRHRHGATLQPACDDLADEFGKLVVEGALRGDSWPAIRRRLCVEAADVCPVQGGDDDDGEL